MEKPVLVVLAAGLGSRYGGNKQIDPVGNHGQLIIDYSIYDARKAGFETVVFIINHRIKDVFEEAIGRRLSKVMNVRYAYQEMEDLPKGYKVPEGRSKPWGTSHAVLSAKNVIDGPFAIINADDYYGPHAFELVYNYLVQNAMEEDSTKNCMVSYLVKNTVTINGSVTRGVCHDKDGFLADIKETSNIQIKDNKIVTIADDGHSYITLDDNTLVSMNLWGFTKSFMKEIENGFPPFLDQTLKTNPLKGEYFLPITVDNLVKNKRGSVEILVSDDRWFGVTYKEDKPGVVSSIKAKTEAGQYPDNLWE